MPSDRELENLALAKEVKLRYDKRNGILGYRQMRTQLNRKLKKGTTVNGITASCEPLN